METDRKFSKREITEQFTTGTHEGDCSRAVSYILETLNVNRADVTQEYLLQLNSRLSSLRGNSNLRWTNARRTKERFESQNADWLSSEFNVPILVVERSFAAAHGRPRLSLQEKAESSRKREAAALSKQEGYDPSKMLLAARHSAKIMGQKDLVAVISETMKSPNRPSKIRKMLFRPSVTKYSEEEALSLLLDLSLSKHEYLAIRKGAKEKGADIYPDYNLVREAKQQLRPPISTVNISDSIAEVELQALLNHTASRITDLQGSFIIEVMKKSANVTTAMQSHVTLICSYGFDGSSGHSLYKQTLREEDGSDENIFATTLIPLRMVTTSGAILWNNRCPQSPRYCRPIKIQYKKESEALVKSEKKKLDDNILQLQDFVVDLGSGYSIQIKYNLFMTLIDGKVLNYLTSTRSSQSCPICHATPKAFNDVSNMDKQVFSPDQNSLQYGIGPLHSWIRLFECCLHIAYRLGLDPPSWQVRSQAQKEHFKLKKQHIQKELWKKLGLRVDQPEPGGSGSTNDGPTARRAFSEPEKLSRILGIDIQLITKFHTILVALCTQLPLDPVLFSEFCKGTAELYVSQYSWYPMPASVHKILIHGAQIIVNSVLPVGMLSEYAAESQNKYYRQFRLFHARKFSRESNLTDLFNRAMDTSDPIISSISLDDRLKNLNKVPLPASVISLLSIPNTDEIQFTFEEEDAASEDVSGVVESMMVLDELQLSEEDKAILNNVYMAQMDKINLNENI